MALLAALENRRGQQHVAGPPARHEAAQGRRCCPLLAAPARSPRRRSLRPNVTHVDFWQRHRDDAYDLVAGLRNGSYMGEEAQRRVAAEGQAFAAKYTFEPARWEGTSGAAAAGGCSAAIAQCAAQWVDAEARPHGGSRAGTCTGGAP
jgi:hypothetical protein